ncbi:hypothetical protein MNEG_12466 [Monoraphidium neglectum]|uniref:CRAL-TRIO domain-containing protein n=1 Tax=Monoraphidium neglectum TaxID=145388 RepID=A0A0D2J6Q4_9CHLO|nr:hypothetical protein MNEG_12466 [Monoraphidium neglectum]KIY95497.1 hypothetical protein MNEG_12466 [Monoraphidium neglectum]|eukprot:XP_013894517.1 hypothetical protein MNEG_12466 [Monoraphidium neglectum]
MNVLRRQSPPGSSGSDSDIRCDIDVVSKGVDAPCTAAVPLAPATRAHKAPSARRGRAPGFAPSPEELEQLITAVDAALPGGREQVHRQLVSGGEEGVTQTQLRRWLRARGWDPAKAGRDLAAHAAWRAEFVPGGRIQEAEVANEIAQGKVFLQGPDRNGRGISIFIGGKHFPRVDARECHRFIYYAIDATIALADPARNPAGRTTGVLCMKDFGWRNLDVMGGINIARAVHLHYVERLDALYIHGTSAAFQRCYKLVEPFIDPVTRSKIVLLPADEAAAREILDKGLGLENLPPFLGGTAELRPIDDAWAVILAQRAQQAQQEGQPNGAGEGVRANMGERDAGSDEEFFEA